MDANTWQLYVDFQILQITKKRIRGWKAYKKGTKHRKRLQNKLPKRRRPI